MKEGESIEIWGWDFYFSGGHIALSRGDMLYHFGRDPNRTYKINDNVA